MYMVMLSIAPCGDQEECGVDYGRYYTVLNVSHDSASSHGVESCTPFCSCNCCSISIMENLPFVEITINEEIWDLNILYSNSNALGTLTVIWQPPQFV